MSVRGRPIELYSIGQGKYSLLVFACIHGNEVGARKTALELLNWFQLQMDLHSRLTLHVIPVLNPDGFEQALQRPVYLAGGTIGRCNAHAIDLNRHFPTPSFRSHATWNRGANYQEEANEVFAGDQPATESEYLALVDAVRAFRPQLVVSLHNVGKDVMPNRLPYAHTAAEQFSSATNFTLFPEAQWKALAQTGTACEWFEQQGIPYLEIELPSRWGSCWNDVKLGFEAIADSLLVID